MKKRKFTGKLSLNKETITRLNETQQNQILGGSNIRCTGDLASCNPCDPNSSPQTCQVGPCPIAPDPCSECCNQQ